MHIISRYLPVIFLFFICSAAVFTSCADKKVKYETVERDTTITRANAYSDIFIDSLKLEAFLSSENLADTSAILIRNFYNSRNYQFAWFTKSGLTEQAIAFWNLHNNFIKYNKDNSFTDSSLHNQMQTLLAQDSSEFRLEEKLIGTELQLTEHFFEFAKYAYTGKVDPQILQWHIPRKKINVISLLDSLLTNKNIEAWEPVNDQYRQLNSKLKNYYELEKTVQFDSISSDKKKVFKRGDKSEIVREIKERLHLLGYYNEADTSDLFNDELKNTVMGFQKNHGLKTDGMIRSTVIDALNVPLQQRIKQMLVNMERMRWMPNETKGNRIVVNIPEYILHVYDSAGKVFDIDIVVGTSAHRTVVFNDMLKYVVFAPYWNIPSSIVKNEILPAMKRNANYLASKRMEQTGSSNGLPVIRQLPGGDNSLGQVKFIFPNTYNIYFHDTPAKTLFSNTSRAFSHGCIRLAEPKKMAQYLLRFQPDWTDEKIDSAMNADKEKWVVLKDAIPVLITYFTAWVDAEGQLNFRNDIYGHDKKMQELMFKN